MSHVLLKYEGLPTIHVYPVRCISRYLEEGKAVMKTGGGTYVVNILGFFPTKTEAECVRRDLEKSVVVNVVHLGNSTSPMETFDENVTKSYDLPLLGHIHNASFDGLHNKEKSTMQSLMKSNEYDYENNPLLQKDCLSIYKPSFVDIQNKKITPTEFLNNNDSFQCTHGINQQVLSEHHCNINDITYNVQHDKSIDLLESHISDVIIEEIPYDESASHSFVDSSLVSQDDTYLLSSKSLQHFPPITNHKYPTKKHCCVFWDKLVTKIARHLLTVHSLENDVIEISTLPTKSPQRLAIIDKLRKLGDFYYNQKLLRSEGSAIPITTRRTRRIKISQPRFVPCPNCLGTYSKSALRLHAKKCITNLEKNPRNLKQRSREINDNVHHKASEALKTRVLPALRSDLIGETARRDELIIIFGNNLIRKYRAPHQTEMIRARLRLLSRFLLAIRKLNPDITTLKSALQLKHLDNILAAVEEIGQLDESGSRYHTPSSAFVLGGYLKHAAKLQFMEYTINEEDEMARKVDILIKFLDESFNSVINPTINETQNENTRRKKVKLPSTNSVKRYIEYAESKIQYFMDEINKNGFTREAWLKLASYTLTALQAFNPKRPGELQRIYIEDFLSYQRINEDKEKDLYDTFSQEEKQQAYKYVRVELRGKKGRTTALLMNEVHVAATLLLLKERPKMNISLENKFVFGIPSTTNKYATLDAYKVMKSCSQECSISEHDLIRGNTLRKHVATAISLNKDRNPFSKERLSDFMSHSFQIHKTFYEVGSSTVDITHVSKMLEEALEPKKNYLGHSKYSASNYNSSTVSENTLTSTPTSTKYNKLNWDTENISTHISPSGGSNNTMPRRKVTPPIFAEGKAKLRRTWSTPERSLARKAL